ncbi:MAG: hypothetical protein HY397_02260 [Candidatus Doudnabacteria bacterium]|nr:hypothetical protein [Candidatus Doudnabacteria bacterium]
MKKIATVLEGRVDQAQWSKLREKYQEVLRAGLPNPIVQTFLLQSKTEPNLWRLMTIWRSQEDLDNYRKSVGTPAGVLVFRFANAEPKLSIFEVSELMDK